MSEYYVDPVSGNDGWDGSSGTPWATIGKAKSTVVAGDIVNLLPGNHGRIQFDRDNAGYGTSWANPIIYRNDPGSPAYSAQLSWLRMIGEHDFYTIFSGLDIYNTSDTMAVQIGGNTIFSLPGPEDEPGTAYVKVLDCKIHGTAGDYAPYELIILVQTASEVFVEDCEIYDSGSDCWGIAFQLTTGGYCRRCHIHDISRSALRTGGGGPYIFEYNHVHTQRPEWGHAKGEDPHGSGISISSHNVTLRGNLVYDGWNTRTIRFYQSNTAGWPGDYGWHDMLVESNVTYGGVNWTEFLQCGDNCVFRNNTFGETLGIQFAKISDGSELSIYNNIFLQDLSLSNFDASASDSFAYGTSRWGNVSEGGNIFYYVQCVGQGYLIRESGFHPGCEHNMHSVWPWTAFFEATTGANAYKLKEGSPAIDFAWPSEAPSTDRLQNGRVGPPDAGAYEFGANPGPLVYDPTNITETAEVKLTSLNINVNDTITLAETLVAENLSISFEPAIIEPIIIVETVAADVLNALELLDIITVAETVVILVKDTAELSDTITIAETVTANIFSSNLVGFWKIDETNGPEAQDSSGEGNTGTLVNDPIWTTWALNFDGNNDHVDCGNDSSLNLTGSLTITASINPHTFGEGGWGRIVDKGSSANGFSFYLQESSSSIKFVSYGGNTVSSNSDIIELNKWQHVAVVYDELAGTLTFYNGGQAVGSVAYSTSPNDSLSDELRIAIRDDLNRAFDGEISNVRIYDFASSATDIYNIFIVDYPSAFYSIGDKEVNENSELTFEVVTRLPQVSMDISQHNLPIEPSMLGNVFSWTPTYADSGNYEVTFRGTGLQLEAFETITITVNDVANVPLHITAGQNVTILGGS